MTDLKYLPKDLVFIAKEVSSWPEGAKKVRLDYDGEICFTGEAEYDFFPLNIDLARVAFRSVDQRRCGVEYSEEQLARAKEQILQDAVSQRLQASEKANPNLPTSEEIKELLGSLEDVVVPYALRSTLDTIESLALTSKEDLEYNKKLVKAINIVLEYYSN